MQHKNILFSDIHSIVYLSREWKQHLIKEAHYVYLATTPATKNFEHSKHSIEN